ncbi:hypothetical protein ACJJI4_11205 [Microbulbifer sp. TRSA002]|uniref:hypothetical protein n=1 Tax=Microbulbifer sp. TRSA002 TaxID=3243382 RepID=UPI0040394878
MSMKLSKVQKLSCWVGLVMLLLPYAIYFYSRSMGLLPAESDWWAQGVNHGPWRWKWQMAFILPSLYSLLFGSICLLLVGLAKSVMKSSVQQLVIYGFLALAYFGAFYLLAKTVFWTID